MSILIDENTKVVVQGLTGREGQFHGLRNRDYGTKVVAGTRPGKGGEEIEGIPIFDSVKEAISATGANTSLVFVPPSFAGEAILEAADAGCDLVVCITEGVPAKDEAIKKSLDYFKYGGMVNPLAAPGSALIGRLFGDIFED